jgi:nitrate reductase NapE component
VWHLRRDGQKVKNKKPSKIATTLFMALAFVIVPTLATALIGVGLLFGITLGWLERSRTKF